MTRRMKQYSRKNCQRMAAINIPRFYNYIESSEELRKASKQEQYYRAYKDKIISLDYIRLRHPGFYSYILKKDGVNFTPADELSKGLKVEND